MKTKNRLAEALKKLMEKEPLDTISVKRLTDMCNINRQTFYYHFRNLYDLLTWIFLNEEIIRSDSGELEEAIISVFVYVKQNFNLIQNSFNSAAKDLLTEFLFNGFYNINMRAILDIDKTHILVKREQQFLARFYGAGYANTLLAWVNGDLPYEEYELINEYTVFFPQYIQEAIKLKRGKNA